VQEKGKSYLRLDCSYENRALCEYYEKQGFKEVGRTNIGGYSAALYEKSVKNDIQFSGAKIALITPDQRILTYLRDVKPDLYMANKWDLPGGGRERDETPIQTILREIKEELGIDLPPNQITYTAPYESERFPGTLSMFMVGKISKRQINHITFGSEGQKYQFIGIDEYLSLPNAVPHLQERFRNYLNKQKITPKSD
jgi:8-oxo-dGTP diphosphatase